MTSFHPQNTREKGNTPRIPVKQQLLLVGALLFLLLGGALTSKISTFFTKDTSDETVAAVTRDEDEPQTNIDYFAQTTLSAEAVMVYDVTKDEVLFAKNSTEQLPLASITKLMTALVAHELLNEDALVAVDETAIRQDGYSDLLVDERFTRQTISDLTLIASTNDGAYALAAAAGAALNTGDGANAFVKAMNVRAEELGLDDTYFKNPSGLDITETEAGSYGTAADITNLMKYLITTYPDVVGPTAEPISTFYSEDGYGHETTNTNHYVNQIPGLIASKTGYTELAGGNLVIAFNAGLNRPIIVTVLGSTRHDRFTDVVQLVEAALAEVASQL